MNFRTIFGAVFAIIAFSFLIGMCKTCKAKQKEKEATTEQPAVDKDGNPTTRPGKAKAAPVITEQTFRILYYSKAKADGSRDVIWTSSELKTPWSGYIADDVPAWDFQTTIEDTIFVTTPGFYQKINRIDVYTDRKTTMRIGGRNDNEPFPARGKGLIYVNATR